MSTPSNHAHQCDPSNVAHVPGLWQQLSALAKSGDVPGLLRTFLAAPLEQQDLEYLGTLVLPALERSSKELPVPEFLEFMQMLLDVLQRMRQRVYAQVVQHRHAVDQGYACWKQSWNIAAKLEELMRLEALEDMIWAKMQQAIAAGGLLDDVEVLRRPTDSTGVPRITMDQGKGQPRQDNTPAAGNDL